MGDALLIVYAYKTLHLSPGQVGAAFAVMSVFVIVGAVLSEQVTKVLSLGRTLVLTAAVLGAGYILVPTGGAVAGFVGLIVVQAVIGFVSPMFDIHVLSLVQGVTPNEQMGRVSGTALSAVYGALSLGYFAGGALGETIGLTGGLAVAGAITIIGGLTLLAGPVAKIKEMPGGDAPDDGAAAADTGAGEHSDSAKIIA
jgi:predicted MFS family arabinose efflux permease